MSLNEEAMISLSTLQSYHWLWEDSAGAVTLIYAQKGRNFGYNRVDSGYATISLGSGLQKDS